MKKDWTAEQEERFKYDLPYSKVNKRAQKERLSNQPVLDNETTRKLLQELLNGDVEYIWDANSSGTGYVVLQVDDVNGNKEKYYLHTDFIAEKGEEELKNTTCGVIRFDNGKRTNFTSVLEGLHFDEAINKRTSLEEERVKELWPGEYNEELGFDGVAPRGHYVQANLEELAIIASTGKSVEESRKDMAKTDKYNKRVSNRAKGVDR